MISSTEMSLETLAAENARLRHDLRDLVEHLDRMAEAIQKGLMDANLCFRELVRLKARCERHTGPGASS